MNFDLSLPTRIVFGAGKANTIGKLVRGLGKRVFVVTSQSFVRGAQAGILKSVLAQLGDASVEASVFSGVEPNPRTTTIERGAGEARLFRPRFVLALGGGSVMDAAKAIALLCENDGGIYEYSYRGPGKPMRAFSKALPIVCVPTIAATGSEANFFAVVTEPSSLRKTTIFGDALYPALSVVDPELTMTVGREATIDGAFDILTHVTESYLSAKEPSAVADRLSEALARAVVEALPRSLENPRDLRARSALSWASTLALSGVLSGREGPWPIHSLEAALNPYLDSAHGRGLALLLPRMMAYDLPVVPERVLAWNNAIFGLQATDPRTALQDGLVAFMKGVGVWVTLGDLAQTKSIDHTELIANSITAALEVKGIWKRGEEPYLDNTRPFRANDLSRFLESCRKPELEFI